MRYILFISILFVSTSIKQNKLKVTYTKSVNKEIVEKHCDTNNILIGDSQTPYVDWGSNKFNLIGSTPGPSNLWEGGKTLNWLLSSLRKYHKDTTVCNVAICIGTNGGFNKRDSISELINQIHLKFPNSKLYVIQGSWGWGGVSNKTESMVRSYYLEFEKLGVIVVEPPIGKIEPHGRKPIYKKIGENLDSLIQR